MFKVFVSEPVNQNGLDLLSGKVAFVHAPDTTKQTALRLVGDCDAALLRATTTFDAEVIAAAPRLRVIARTGVGYNNVDLDACDARGIPVCITPGTNHGTVAEQAVAMIFALAKQVIHQDRAVREGRWSERFSPRQYDVAGKTVSLIGLGAIGLATARKCLALGMRVLAYDPYFKGEADTIRLVDLETAFREGDFVSLHCPSTPQTRGLVNSEKLGWMKPTAYLINTSRGDLVIEQDLIKAIHQGAIAGAGLDVYEQEPVAPTHPLLELPNVILSPHLAGSTIESNQRIAVLACIAILDVLEGRVPQHIVNLKQYA